MAEPSSGDPSENEADVDLKGVIKDLQDEIKNLNKLLQTFGKNVKIGNKVTKMGVDDHLRLIKAQGQMVRENADYRKSIQNGSSAMDQFAAALQGGFSPMQMFVGITKKMGGLSTELDDFKKKTSEFADIQKEFGITEKKGDKWDTRSDEDKQRYIDKEGEVADAKTKKEGAFGGQGGASGKLVEGMSSMKKFAEKHATGMIIGAGSAAVLIGILKKALDASPMFQQMMKLLNFGIMMVLRPIGDFFGFLFRPILIMLLRKFIIPWYTKMYPVMMKMGNIIGEKFSGAFEALAAGDVAGAFAILFEEVDFNQILTDAFAGIHAWLEETDWEKVWLDIQTGLVAFGTEIWDRVLVPLFTAIAAELGKVDWWDAIWDTLKVVIPVLAVADLVAGLFGIGDNQWFNEMGQEIRKWFLKGLEEATVSWTNFFEQVKQAILTSMGLGFLIDDKKSETDKEPSIFGTSNYTPTTGGSPRQHGGLIEEPILGIGRSGRRYMFGEAGTEVVTPMNEISGSGSITINIQNMSGSQQDLNNLRQVILDVVQQSSARRGRA